jgi:hypothetical protein
VLDARLLDLGAARLARLQSSESGLRPLNAGRRNSLILRQRVYGAGFFVGFHTRRRESTGIIIRLGRRGLHRRWNIVACGGELRLLLTLIRLSVLLLLRLLLRLRLRVLLLLRLRLRVLLLLRRRLRVLLLLRRRLRVLLLLRRRLRVLLLLRLLLLRLIHRLSVLLLLRLLLLRLIHRLSVLLLVLLNQIVRFSTLSPLLLRSVLLFWAFRILRHVLLLLLFVH